MNLICMGLFISSFISCFAIHSRGKPDFNCSARLYQFTESQVHVENCNCIGLLSSPVLQHIMNVIEGVSGERILQIANDVISEVNLYST